MSKTLYSPRLSDEVIRLLYQEGKRRRIPMTRLADELILNGLQPSAIGGAASAQAGSDPEMVRFPEAA